jgi:uncharacterized protein (UPF0335 family)
MSNETLLKQHFESIVSLIHEKITLDDDIKMIKESLEAEGLDKPDIAAFIQAATAKAREKTQEAKEKADKVSEMIQRFA